MIRIGFGGILPPKKVLPFGFQEGGWVSYHKPGIADIQQHRVSRRYPIQVYFCYV